MTSSRRCLPLILALAAAGACPAEVFNIATNVGTVKVTTDLKVADNQRPTLTAEIANESPYPIQKIHLCVASRSVKKGCLFTLWTKQDLAAGASVSITASSNRKIADGAHSVIMDELIQRTPPPPRTPTPIDPIVNVFVAEIGGNSGPMIREQLIAALINSQRFRVTKDPASADAVFDGRAESREVTRIASRSTSLATGTLSTEPWRGPDASSLSGSAASAVGGTVVLEAVALHLTTKSGLSVWAWDGTKPCVGVRAKCAVADLLDAAR